MSVRLRLLNRWIKWREKPLFRREKDPRNLDVHIHQVARLTTRAPRGTITRCAKLQTADRAIPVRWINPENEPQKPLILYIHGGAFVMGSPETHKSMVAVICQITGLGACLPKYRLAPEHPFPAGLNDITAVYAALADHPGGVILGGDSAGGNLVFALMAEIVRLNLPRPLGCFAFSPLLDMTWTGESITRNAKADVLLPIEQIERVTNMYLQDMAPNDPRVSPLFADLSGCCPVWLTVGTTEILLDDSRRMAEKLRKQGTDVTLLVEEDRPHVWAFFHNFLPEAQETLQALGQWISRLKADSTGS